MTDTNLKVAREGYEYKFVLGSNRDHADSSIAGLNALGAAGWRVIYTSFEAGDYVVLMERSCALLDKAVADARREALEEAARRCEAAEGVCNVRPNCHALDAVNIRALAAQDSSAAPSQSETPSTPNVPNVPSAPNVPKGTA